MGTESWLDSSIPDALFFPTTYQTYRRDRNIHGGGIFICVREHLIAHVDYVSVSSEFLTIIVTLNNGKKVHVSVAYRPPNDNTAELFDDMLAKLLELNLDENPNQYVILGGDLNLPNLNWNLNTPLGVGNHLTLSVAKILDLGLEQIVRVPTRTTDSSANILDVIITNCSEFVESISVEKGISDHELVVCDLNLNPKLSKPKPREVFLYSKADVQQFGKYLGSKFSTFTTSSASSSVDECWANFKSLLLEAAQQFIPTRKFSSNGDPPWINNEIKALKKRARKAHADAKKSNNYTYFYEVRAELNFAKKAAESNFLEFTLQSDLKNAPKKFWRYYKYKAKGNNCSVPPLKLANGVTITDSKGKANEFNSFFQSVFTAEDLINMPNNINLTFVGATEMSDITTTRAGIVHLLINLDANRAAGPDGICAKLLQLVPEQVAAYLEVVYNKCLQKCSMPSEWKLANIVPVFKKGSKSTPGNYRPISLTSVCCKMFEHILTSNIATHMESKNYFSIDQFGFRKSRSCEMQLARVCQDIAFVLDKGQSADLVFLDFAKAFDKVPHNRLLKKLRAYGLCENMVRLIESFLSGRMQQVVLDGEVSDKREVTSGVPQGSVLGPLLFIIYINDLPNLLTSKIKLFADDCLLYQIISSPNDSLSLQNDLALIDTWCHDWQMTLNYDKCQVMHVTKSRNPANHPYVLGPRVLDTTDVYRYLGVDIHKDLKWNHHVDRIVSKSKSALYVVRKVFNKAPTNVKSTAVFTLVRPILEYGGAVFDPNEKGLIAAIEMVQRRAARFCTNRYGLTDSVGEMLKILDWDSLELRRMANRLSLFSRVYSKTACLSDLVSMINPPDYVSLRKDHQHKLALIRCSKEVGQSSFLPRSVKQWNNLPSGFFESCNLNNPQLVRTSLLKLLKGEVCNN